MTDLHEVHSYLRPSVAKFGQNGGDRRAADELLRAHDGLDLEAIFDDPKPEPAYLHFARTREDQILALLGLAGCLGAGFLIGWLLVQYLPWVVNP